MAKKPAFQFYPGDWMKDPELRSVSIAARGLWIDMLCLMFESSERGYLLIRGKAPSEIQLARMVGCTGEELSLALDELKNAGVLSQTGMGVLFSRRLVRDAELSNKRSKSGKKGGNPNFAKGQPNPYYDEKDKQNDNQNDNQKISTVDKQKITPSSSTSVIIPNGINKETRTRTDFFRIGMNLVKQKPSEYLQQNMQSSIEQFMMSLFSGMSLEKIYEKLDAEYFGYEFKDPMHVRNSFKTVAEKLRIESEKAQKSGKSPSVKSNVYIPAKPMGAVRHD